MRFRALRAAHCPAALTTALVLAVAAVPVASAQRGGADDWMGRCAEWSQRNRVTLCDQREVTIPTPGGSLSVIATPNGGIRVVGADRRDIRVVARIQAHGRTESSAREILSEITIRTDGEIRSTGPRARGNEGWSVSYVVEVPRAIDLLLESQNGSIGVEAVRGDIQVRTTNGALTLTSVAGRVHGRTTNGAVNVALEGTGWAGEGLDLSTTNGGVHVTMPERYNAHLEARTVNGGISVGFPVTIRGRLGRQLSTDIGRGGATLRVETTNGGVTIGPK